MVCGDDTSDDIHDRDDSLGVRLKPFFVVVVIIAIWWYSDYGRGRTRPTGRGRRRKSMRGGADVNEMNPALPHRSTVAAPERPLGRYGVALVAIVVGAAAAWFFFNQSP